MKAANESEEMRETMSHLNRRAFIGAFGSALALGGCVATAPAPAPIAMIPPAPPPPPGISPDYMLMYGPVPGEKFPIPAVDLTKVNPAFLRSEIAYSSPEPPGTIIIDPQAHYLYLVQPWGRAIRYGVGVGREGFAWAGVATINSKQEWPDWYPPKEMLEREADLAAKMSQLQSGIGMPGGPGNPLGARAMYLWKDGKDTLFRIHGTIQPATIGTSVSSGCIRMINQDAIDLYNRTPVGTNVVVLGAAVG
jgi:lipoprotein-anchoring transpeptidase ErfK/SrfK